MVFTPLFLLQYVCTVGYKKQPARATKAKLKTIPIVYVVLYVYIHLHEQDTLNAFKQSNRDGIFTLTHHSESDANFFLEIYL
jgi:hypothetical protein